MCSIYLANQNQLKDESPNISIKCEISQQELDKLNSAFSFCAIYHFITQIKDIVVENGIDFQKYMSPANLQMLCNKPLQSDRMILHANKVVLNYATSIKTYVDMETRLLSKHKKDIKSFENLCHQFYDQHFEYRFWANFRNYIVHCEFPYCAFSGSIDQGCRIICTKKHLMLFDNWKHSKADILVMDDEIDLPSMVNTMSGLIIALYINFFTYFGDQIINGIKEYEDCCRKHSVTSPIIIRTNNPRDYGDCSMQLLPVTELRAAFDVLKSNPNVNINIVDCI